jgi:hypothetical protein
MHTVSTVARAVERREGEVDRERREGERQRASAREMRTVSTIADAA